MPGRNRFDGLIEFCGSKANCNANPHTGSETNCDCNAHADANTETDGDAYTYADAETIGNADTVANRYPDSDGILPSSGGLWSHFLKHEYEFA